MPSGRCRPSAFGMYRRRTGCGRYVPARSAAPSSVEQALDAVLLDVGERLAIDARRAAVPFHPPPCLLEDVTPPDPIHQGVEAAFRGSLGRDPESALQLAHFVDGPVAHRGSWNRTCRSCPRACLRRRRDHRRDPSLPLALFVARLDATTIPSDARCARLAFAVGLYESRCPDPGGADGPLVFRSSPCTRAAPPTPPRPARVHLRTGAQQTWPSPRHDRLGSRVVNLSRLQASRDVAARVLASSVEAFDTPLGPPGSLPTPGVCYSALRRLPRRDME